MQKAEILSLAEQLIAVYHDQDFELLLSHMTEGHSPSLKLLVKMELNRVMMPCTKAVDLRGRVQGECRSYELEGITHWLDDVAFNEYQKGIKKYGSYTDGVWDSLYNTRNNYRVMKERGIDNHASLTESNSPFEVEIINLGYDLKRKENRLKLATQVEITLPDKQIIHGVSVNLSPSGAKFKVPAAFRYKLGEIIEVNFSELSKKFDIPGLKDIIVYRVLGIEDSYINDAVKFLRLKRLSKTDAIECAIEANFENEAQRTRHDNQDRIIRTRTRAYEHTYLKHTCQLPVFFSANELKLVLLSETNRDLWDYWQDDRNQQSLSSLFNKERMSLLAKPGIKGSSNTLYTFKHTHQDKTIFFSMMMTEGDRELRKLFWHIGAKKASWKAFRFSVFELSEQEKESLSVYSNELAKKLSGLTHCGILQEIADSSTANDYLLIDKPKLPSSQLNPFRHTRQVVGAPSAVYFDARPQRKEPRYYLKSPIDVTTPSGEVSLGNTLDLSKEGLSLFLKHPTNLQVGSEVLVNYHEIKRYDKTLPLDKVPYRVVKTSPDNQHIQLSIAKEKPISKITAFFSRIIENNLDKLSERKELLPDAPLIEALHEILLDKMVSSPIFVEKQNNMLKTKAIGVNYPLPAHIMLLAKLGHNENVSLEPIFKGHINTLLTGPMKRIDGAKPQFNDVYLAVTQFGSRIQSFETRLNCDFKNIKERIAFIRSAQTTGQIFILRLCSTPIFDPITTLSRKDIEGLATISMPHAKKVEKEINSLVGYGELIDITEEVLIRLELIH
jgi:hypothetical protein